MFLQTQNSVFKQEIDRLTELLKARDSRCKSFHSLAIVFIDILLDKFMQTLKYWMFRYLPSCRRPSHLHLKLGQSLRFGWLIRWRQACPHEWQHETWQSTTSTVNNATINSFTLDPTLSKIPI